MRDHLIKLSIKYQGEYDLIKKNLGDLDVDDIKVVDNAITILDDIYPEKLKYLPNPPFVLYYNGNINLLNLDMIGVVGSRNHCSYSKEVCQRIIKNQKINVISGLAIGIDSVAHQSAIDNQLATIAVLGSCLNMIYPKQNYSLAKQISKTGLIISEYPNDTKTLKHHFVMRNRIIAALSDKLYVLEASKVSGTMITANIALDLGIDIYCLAGSVLNEQFLGCHKLINDGAFLIESV